MAGFPRLTAAASFKLEAVTRPVQLLRIGYRPTVPVTAQQFVDPAVRARREIEKRMQVLAFFNENHPETTVDAFVTAPFDFDEEFAAARVDELRAPVCRRASSVSRR